MIWRVDVDCWRVGKYRPTCVKRSVEIEAADGKEAKRKGLEYAENTCGGEYQWESFEFRSAATVRFPREVKP